ncbi:hypothetical protein POL68_24545 [Stigmatella sp. ncwal1]|uniref:Uncharacterized protein n=1 Tax=Stigmatella ashevillensis TaxID=2995309 RepID=A0ABT5DDA1_9BACT|nr:hypothetical protein [Stigmatella ashevillena]MDC0711660.1 hypothetical protein [Stigmatella ashevillena]
MSEQKFTASPAIPGLTLTDWIAIQALAARIGSGKETPDEATNEEAVSWAYKLADAIIKKKAEREAAGTRVRTEDFYPPEE